MSVLKSNDNKTSVANKVEVEDIDFSVNSSSEFDAGIGFTFLENGEVGVMLFEEDLQLLYLSESQAAVLLEKLKEWEQKIIERDSKSLRGE